MGSTLRVVSTTPPAHRGCAKYFADSGDARTQAQIALAWIWTRSQRTIPIPGFKTVAQVQENIQAMEFGLLSREQMKKIDEIFERAPVLS